MSTQGSQRLSLDAAWREAHHGTLRRWTSRSVWAVTLAVAGLLAAAVIVALVVLLIVSFVGSIERWQVGALILTVVIGLSVSVVRQDRR